MSDGKPLFIQPGEYPVMSGNVARDLVKALASSTLGLAAAKVLSDNVKSLRGAVIAALPKLEAAGSDSAKAYAAAHEIRGLAGNADLKPTAQIAGVLCHYLDCMQRANRDADPVVVRLHVASIGQTARAANEDCKISQHVAKELADLVKAKLAEIP